MGKMKDKYIEQMNEDELEYVITAKGESYFWHLEDGGRLFNDPASLTYTCEKCIRGWAKFMVHHEYRDDMREKYKRHLEKSGLLKKLEELE